MLKSRSNSSTAHAHAFTKLVRYVIMLTVIDWPLPLSPRLADLLLRALALCHQQPAPPALLLPRSAVGFKRSVVRVALAWPNLP